MNKRVVCPACNGVGIAPFNATLRCLVCCGSGVLRDPKSKIDENNNFNDLLKTMGIK